VQQGIVIRPLLTCPDTSYDDVFLLLAYRIGLEVKDRVFETPDAQGGMQFFKLETVVGRLKGLFKFAVYDSIFSM
jgi:hypothetical protein